MAVLPTGLLISSKELPKETALVFAPNTLSLGCSLQ